MKKIVSLMGIIALCAASFTACNKASENDIQEKGKHIIKVTPVLAETRTVLDESGNTISVKWADSDVEIDPEGNSKFHVWENGAKGLAEATLNQDNTIATITCAFDENTSTNLVYSSCFAKQLDDSGNPVILEFQNPGSSSFDPDADLLIGEDITKTSQPDELLVNFSRPVALVKMTLKGLEVGESLTSVFVTSKSGKMTGVYNRANGAFDFTNGEETIVVCPTGVTVGSDGTAPVYFVSAPIENEILEIEVYTSKGGAESDEEYHYKKEFAKGISFPANKLTRFTANLTGCEVVTPTDKYYTKVTSNDDLGDGQYLIVYEGGKNSSNQTILPAALNGGLTSFDVANNIISVTIEEDGILSTPTTDAASFSIDVTHGTILSSSGLYIFSSSYANELKFSESVPNYVNSVSIDESGNAVISVTHSGGTVSLRYNYASDQNRFRYYKSGQQSIALYKLEAVARTPLATPSNLAVNPTTKTVSWDAVTDAASYSVTVGETIESVTETTYIFNGVDDYYDVSVIAVPAPDATDKKNSEPATILNAKFGNPVLTKPSLVKGEVNETSIEVTWTVDARATAGYTASIYDEETKIEEKEVTTGSVTFENLTQNKQYTIKVFAKAITEGDKPYGASEVATIDVNTDETVTIAKILRDGVISSVTLPTATVMAKQGDRAILSDATGSILAFQPTGTFNIGDQVRVAGAISVYSNEYQFNKPTITKIGEGTLSYPDENLITTDAPLTAYAVGDPSTVRVTYATLRGVVDESGNLVIGNKTVTVYSALTSLKGKTVDAVGYLVGWYKNNNNVLSIYFVKVSASEYVDPNAPIASVDPTSKTWAYNEVDAATFAVTATNCTWDYSPKTLSWASITADANGITVTPNGEAGTSADNTGTITVSFTNTNSGYEAIDPVEISLTQTKAPVHTITVNPSTNPIELSSTANTPYSITITSNYAWNAETTGSGFTVTPSQGVAGETTVVVKPTADGGATVANLGTITFSDGTASETFTVKQKEKKDITKGSEWASVSPLKTDTDGINGGDQNQQYGIQVYGGSTCTFTKTDYSDGIESITIHASTTNKGVGTITVTVGGQALTYNGNSTLTLSKLGNTDRAYTFTSSELLTGTVVVTVSASANSLYFKQVIINED